MYLILIVSCYTNVNKFSQTTKISNNFFYLKNTQSITLKVNNKRFSLL